MVFDVKRKKLPGRTLSCWLVVVWSWSRGGEMQISHASFGMLRPTHIQGCIDSMHQYWCQVCFVPPSLFALWWVWCTLVKFWLGDQSIPTLHMSHCYFSTINGTQKRNHPREETQTDKITNRNQLDQSRLDSVIKGKNNHKHLLTHT